MARAQRPRRRSAPPRTRPAVGGGPIRVAVIGAGIAGMTAALRLLERGYQVTVYDRKSYVGGKLGAHTHTRAEFAEQNPADRDGVPYLVGRFRPGTYHEHCYHMFLNWYHNFWQLADDIGVPRDKHFEARSAVKYLRRGEFPRVMTIANSGSPETEWANITSGVRSIPDMFLNHYSVFDLLAQRFDGGLLRNYTINGFLQSRPYATEGSATLYQDGLAKAFAAPSFVTSARSYQAFLKYSMRLPEPMMWLLKNDAHHGFQRPFKAKLDALGCRWKLSHDVSNVRPLYFFEGSSGGGRPLAPAQCPIEITAIGGAKGRWPHPHASPGDESSPLPTPGTDVAEYDYVIVAIPPSDLRGLLRNPQLAQYFQSPEVETIGKLHNEPMASIDIYFKRKIPGIPKEHVVLLGSMYGLTFIDNSQLWPGIEGTALNIASTDFRALADLPEGDAFRYIYQELRAYLPLDDNDILFGHIETNASDQLFVNEIGSEKWRPGPRTGLPSVFLAGDYCRTFIDVVTVEGAVVSALQAVRELQDQVRRDYGDRLRRTKLLDPVTIVEPEAYPQWTMVAAATLLAPYAAAAKVWSWIEDTMASDTAGTRAESSLLQASMTAALAPWQIGAELWTSAWSACMDFWTAKADRR